jgi:hypothetical protein
MDKVVMVCVACLLAYLLLVGVLESTSIIYKLYSQNSETEHHRLGKNNWIEFLNNSYLAKKQQKNQTSYENGTTYADLATKVINYFL